MLEDKYYADPNSGCWIWLGRCNEKDYAYIGKGTRAARLFYENAKGPIPHGLTVDHLCRIRCCVNPYHLELVTQTENRRRGVRAQVNDEMVNQIRRRSATESAKSLSKELGIPRTTIRRIIHGQPWRGGEHVFVR